MASNGLGICGRKRSSCADRSLPLQCQPAASGSGHRDMIDGRFMRPQFISALLLVALPMMAQLPAPNKAGISAGHDVLRVKDMDAANKFWQAVGGQPVQFAGRLNLTKFPGVLLLNIGGGPGRGKQAPVPAAPPAELAGSEGSSLDF